MRIILACGTAALALLAWAFWQDILVLWPLLLPLIKSVWAKTTVLVLAIAGKGFVANTVEDLFRLLTRRFVAWLPGKAARMAAGVLVPPAARSAFKRAQRHAKGLAGWLGRVGSGLPGGVVGLALSVTGTIAVAVLAFVYFGLQAVVVFKFVPEFVWSALTWLWAYAITFLFRFSIWRGLTRTLGHFWDRHTPVVLRDRFKRLRRLLLRHAIRHRKSFVRAADDRGRAALSVLRRLGARRRGRTDRLA